MIMNEEQLSKIKDQYAEMIMENMDYKDMERLLFEANSSTIPSISHMSCSRAVNISCGFMSLLV